MNQNQERKVPNVVVQAFGSWSPNVPDGMVGVYATMNGESGASIPHSCWLVPIKEYQASTGRFAIDAERHIQLPDSTEFGQEASESGAAWRAVVERLMKSGAASERLEAQRKVMEKRYISGYWAHIFGKGTRDQRECRFVFDRVSIKVLHLEILDGVKGWMPASEAELLDFEDSLKTANDDAIENPDNWNLDESNSLPDWVSLDRQMTETSWDRDDVQFPRLLAEVMATQELNMGVLADSMDLSIEAVSSLFDRADKAWEAIKAQRVPLAPQTQKPRSGPSRGM